jgi:spore maturation protein CgeB
MRIVVFCHSLRSDWNHGNAHFLRGIVSELVGRGHDVAVYEPKDAWSAHNLVADAGPAALDAYREAYPTLDSIRYDPTTLDVDAALDGADLVLVHEWNDHALVAKVGEARRRGGRFRLLFHDTHHRAVTDLEAMRGYDLQHYDGALVFGEVLRDIYQREGLAARAFTWHEAADPRVFHPLASARLCDLVWVGNWGDDERTRELHEFLMEPVRALRLSARVHGVRYPDHALAALAAAGILYRGYLPNHRAPEVFAHHRVTVHVPRGPYARALPGIPTIRVFEALSCGIPLVSAPWDDAEGLFSPGRDYLVAKNGIEMKRLLHEVLHDGALARTLAIQGQRTIAARHTCAHRIDELLAIHRSLAHRTADVASSSHSAGAHP